MIFIIAGIFIVLVAALLVIRLVGVNRDNNAEKVTTPEPNATFEATSQPVPSLQPDPLVTERGLD